MNKLKISAGALLVIGVAIGTAAALDPKVGPNIRLGDDPSLLPTNLLAQAEPHVIRSYTDPGLVVATFQEGRLTTGGAAAIGVSVSHDGGQTWTRSLLPKLTWLTGGPYQRATDSVAAVDLNGNLYVNCLAFEPLSTNAAYRAGVEVVCKSTDGGASFGPPQVVFSPPFNNSITDKNWMAVNTYAGSPTANRIAVTWTQYFNAGATNEFAALLCSYSDNGGTNWSAPVRFGPDYCQSTQPFFFRDGSLGVVYWNEVAPPDPTQVDPDTGLPSLSGTRFEFVRSPDGGATFGPPQIVAPVELYDAPLVRDGWFLVSATTDRQTGAIFVTYQGTVDQGTNPIPRVLFTKSIDQGRHWTPPIAVNDTPRAQPVFNPTIAATPDGQHLSITFYDGRNDPGGGFFTDLYLAESFDGGDTWQPNLRLSEVSSDLRKAPQADRGYFLGDYLAIAPALDFATPAVAVWIDTRGDSPDPYAVRINRTQGTTFDAWRALRFSATQLADPAISGENADPDHDGIANLAEYAFGLEPTRVDTNQLTLALSPLTAQPAITVSYEIIPVLGDITFTWQAAPSLTNWLPATPDAGRTLATGDPFKRRIEADFQTGTGAANFFRLQLSRQPAGP